MIVLVPEIALTPQTVGRFQARFGDTVALLHSALGEGERYDEWRRLRSGEARIAVGPRSAVFAPVERLGLVVVDEEHDSSYKHEGDPRYDARRVAAWRAARAGAALLVGSATPRPETWRALPRLELRERADGRPLPPVRVLDMRGTTHPLHPDTRRALGEARKAIVLLNRRGWSNFLTCRTCGKVWECPQCDVALVLHRAQDAIACHHCGHREPVPQRCDACGSLAVARYGAGHRAGGGGAQRGARRAGVPARRRHGGREGRGADAAGALRRRARRAAARHADGGQGARLPGRHAGRGARRGLDPALPGLPRRGADVRADRPARGAGGARAARRARAGPDHGAGRAGDRGGARGTTRRASWPASWRGARRCATRRSPT